MSSPKLDLISVNELADRIGMSVGFVYKQLRAGRIAHLTIGDGSKKDVRSRRTVRILRADAERYIQSLTVKAVA